MQTKTGFACNAGNPLQTETPRPNSLALQMPASCTTWPRNKKFHPVQRILPLRRVFSRPNRNPNTNYLNIHNPFNGLGTSRRITNPQCNNKTAIHTRRAAKSGYPCLTFGDPLQVMVRAAGILDG